VDTVPTDSLFERNWMTYLESTSQTLIAAAVNIKSAGECVPTGQREMREEILALLPTIELVEREVWRLLERYKDIAH
jgi:hypothetical protein